MHVINTTVNPVVVVPDTWNELEGQPTDNQEFNDYMDAEKLHFVGEGGTIVTQSGTTVFIQSTEPTGTTVQFHDILGDAMANHSLHAYLDAKSGTGHTHQYSTILNTPDLNAYALSGHNHNLLYAPIIHVHDQYSLTGHGHTIANITNLQASLDSKSSTGHTHSTLYSPLVHTHAYSAITNTPNLNAYALSGHNHTGIYSPVNHLHTGVYSVTAHTHTDKLNVQTFNGYTGRTVTHATISHNANLTVGSTTSEYAIVFNTNDDLGGITHVTGDSKVYVPTSGDYLISISAVIDTTSNANCLMDIWIKINGTNVPNSNTQVAVDTSGIQTTLACTYILDMTAGQYFEFFYHGNNTNIRMLAIGTQTNPVRPACPSVIITILKVSE